MTLVLSDTSTSQGLIEQLKFITGQDSLSNNDAIRLINLAIDDYSYLALTGNRRWKLDDANNTDLPTASATINSSETHIPLETEVLTLEEVQFNGNILTPIDRTQYKTSTPTQEFGTGTPTHYDYDSHSLFLYPIPTASGTVTVYYSRPENYFATTDTTATIGIPRIHHNYLILHAANTLSLRTNDPIGNKIKQELIEAELKIKDFFGLRDQDTRKNLRPLIQNNK